MPRHRLRDAVWASLHARLGAIPGIWKKDAERLRRFVEAVAFVLRTGGGATAPTMLPQMGSSGRWSLSTGLFGRATGRVAASFR
jgi:hypothetical protein